MGIVTTKQGLLAALEPLAAAAQKQAHVLRHKAKGKVAPETRIILRTHEARSAADRREIKRKGYLEREVTASYLRRRKGSKETPVQLTDRRPVPKYRGRTGDFATREDFGRASDFMERAKREPGGGQEFFPLADAGLQRRDAGFRFRRVR